MNQTHLMKPPYDSHEFDVDWYHHINEKAIEFIDTERLALTTSDSLPYNIDIQYSEVKHAVARVRLNSVPVPDAILSIMVAEAWENLKKALQMTYNNC